MMRKPNEIINNIINLLVELNDAQEAKQKELKNRIDILTEEIEKQHRKNKAIAAILLDGD